MARFLSFLALFASFFVMSEASGHFQVVINSPETILISHTICANMRCNKMDNTARRIKVKAGVPFNLQDGRFAGDAPSHFDLNLVAYNLQGEMLADSWEQRNTSTAWKKESLSTGTFEILYRYRSVCDDKYYGQLCNRYCEERPDQHTECTENGESRCVVGWTGKDCMTPVCENKCNGHGKCVAPGRCHCQNGYTGNSCETCQPKRGCLHGGCANNVSLTCACKPGYGGELCNLDLEYCTRKQPCSNGGTCFNDASAAGYKCQCPEGFVGARCEIPIEKVLCRNDADICWNGGVCISLSPPEVQCHCPPGFFGKHCELSDSDSPCAALECRNGGLCHLNKKNEPSCLCPKCFRGPNCDIPNFECMRNLTMIVSSAPDLIILREQHIVEKTTLHDHLYLFIAASVMSVFGFLCIMMCFYRRLRRTILKNSRTGHSEATVGDSTRPTVWTAVRTVEQHHKTSELDQESCSSTESSPRRLPRLPSPTLTYFPPPPYATSSDGCFATSSSSGRHYMTLPTTTTSSSAAADDENDYIPIKPCI
ncbi:unnamed protein product [Caenorhabditis auriculariae]|uniref:Delta-like protein n=1 Tax=Caenorhabditis auriculariae TaxID=2777116 RepID=A0A8S1HEX2_9PELO|nr:unnamed protein product [Caenorhabditis auriculariae]